MDHMKRMTRTSPAGLWRERYREGCNDSVKTVSHTGARKKCNEALKVTYEECFYDMIGYQAQ